VTLVSHRSIAPRALTAGALRVRFLVLGLAFLGLAAPKALSAQIPDTIPAADSAQVQDVSPAPLDSLLALPDSLRPVISDSVQASLDSLAAVVDSLVDHVDTFPRFPAGVMPSWEAGVWSWDRTALAADRALTLAELVSQIPGVIPLRGGDYGTPTATVSFGGAGGRVRVMLDGFEWLPLEGGVADLSRIGLGGLEEVRVERHPGELRIEIRSLEPTDPQPVTTVNVGTGDLGTNVLRGVLAHPTAMGGAFTFTLDRLETRGPGLDATGSLGGFGLRYALARGNRGGLSAELRRSQTKTEIADFPTNLIRSDWNVRGRWKFTEDLIGEALWGASSLTGDPDDPVFSAVDTRRSQMALRAGYERGAVWGNASARFLGAAGVPTSAYQVEAGVSDPRAISVDGSVRLERWSEESASTWRVRAVTAPVLGFSLFASHGDGKTGTPFVSQFEEYLQSLKPEPVDSLAVDPDLEPQDSVPPLEKPVARFTERTGTRVGAAFSWRSLSLSGAWLSMEADSLHPLGLLLDQGAVVLEGAERTGYEVAASLPLPITGFRVDGALQTWDDELPYMPKQTWDGSITYHRVFKESRNLELWGTLGVTGHEGMLLPIVDPDPPVPDPIYSADPGEGDPVVEPDAGPDPGPDWPALLRMPVYRDIFMQIQVRIVTLNIFLRWENLAAKEDNFDFPGREQPRFRTLYGVRWTLNN